MSGRSARVLLAAAVATYYYDSSFRGREQRDSDHFPKLFCFILLISFGSRDYCALCVGRRVSVSLSKGLAGLPSRVLTD